MLGILLGAKNELLSDSQIADNIIGVIFAAHDTTASVLTWVLKYLHDNPNVLEAVTVRNSDIIKLLYIDLIWVWISFNLRVNKHEYIFQREQEVIRRKLQLSKNKGLTWDDTRHMPLTSRVPRSLFSFFLIIIQESLFFMTKIGHHLFYNQIISWYYQVIQETLRSASILSFTFREAVEDVEFQGYVIPKGWKVLPLFRSIHHCSDFFPQPEKFDPSRFEVY